MMIDDSVSWSHLAAAVKHELFPKMGTAMDAVIEGLAEEDKFNVMDLGQSAVKKVIERLKKKRKMTSSQLVYIKGMVERAKHFMES